MNSSVSPKDEIWFLRVCHHISTSLYLCATVHFYGQVSELSRDPWVGLLRSTNSHIKKGDRTDTSAFKMPYRHFWSVASDSLPVSLWSQLEMDLIYNILMRPSSGKLLCTRFKISGNKSTITKFPPYQLAAQIRAVISLQFSSFVSETEII